MVLQIRLTLSACVICVASCVVCAMTRIHGDLDGARQPSQSRDALDMAIYQIQAGAYVFDEHGRPAANLQLMLSYRFDATLRLLPIAQRSELDAGLRDAVTYALGFVKDPRSIGYLSVLANSPDSDERIMTFLNGWCGFGGAPDTGARWLVDESAWFHELRGLYERGSEAVRRRALAAITGYCQSAEVLEWMRRVEKCATRPEDVAVAQMYLARRGQAVDGERWRYVVSALRTLRPRAVTAYMIVAPHEYALEELLGMVTPSASEKLVGHIVSTARLITCDAELSSFDELRDWAEVHAGESRLQWLDAARVTIDALVAMQDYDAARRHVASFYSFGHPEWAEPWAAHPEMRKAVIDWVCQSYYPLLRDQAMQVICKCAQEGDELEPLTCRRLAQLGLSPNGDDTWTDYLCRREWWLLSDLWSVLTSEGPR